MDETRKELPLPFPEFSGDLPLLPVRMLNDFQPFELAAQESMNPAPSMAAPAISASISGER